MRSLYLRWILFLPLILSSAMDVLAQDPFIRIGAGVTGTYPIFAAKLAELINDNIEGVHASTKSGSDYNILLQQKQLEIFISYTFNVKLNAEGKGATGYATPDVRHVMTLYGSTLQTATPRKGPILTLKDLEKGGFRIFRGPRTAVTYMMVEAALQAHGFSSNELVKQGNIFESISFGDQLMAMQDGRLDVAFYTGPSPYGNIVQLNQTPGIRLLDFDDEAMDRMEELLPGISRKEIPAGTYENQDEPVQAPYVVNQLVVHADLPEDFVYQLTKLMNEQYEAFHGLFPGSREITPDDPMKLNKIKIHPGAERYYREVGKLP